MLTSAEIAIIGATGAVGSELLSILAHKGVPPERIRAYASSDRPDRVVSFGKTQVNVEPLPGDPSTVAASLNHCDLAFLAVDAEHARILAPALAGAGMLVIDNSSAFRTHPDVPLVIPEVNGDAIPGRGSIGGSIIANPNCSTIIMLTALTPIHRVCAIQRISVCTYQAVSGAGAAAVEELRRQTGAVLNNSDPELRVFAEPCAFNVFSHDSAVDIDTGMNLEEQKLVRETHRIWSDPHVGIAATCMRVPVVRSHTECITITLSAPLTEHVVRDVLEHAPGLSIMDDRVHNDFPTALKATARDDILVGRIRADRSQPGNDCDGWRGYHLLVCGDQLRKGAALNAVQIAEAAFTPRAAHETRSAIRAMSD